MSGFGEWDDGVKMPPCMTCGCGWRSEFDAEFVARYKAKWKLP